MTPTHLLAARLTTLVDALSPRLDAALRALAAALLPSLAPAHLSAAARLCAAPALDPGAIASALARRRAIASRTVARIAGEEAFGDREALLAAWGAELEAARATLSMAQARIAHCEGLDGFAALVEARFGTSEEAVPPLDARFEWLRDVAAGICATLGLDDFGQDVLPRYRALLLERDEVQAAVFSLEARITGLLDLVREHEAACRALEADDTALLDAARAALERHLVTLDAEALEALADEGGEAAERAHEAASLRRRLDALDAMLFDELKPLIRALRNDPGGAAAQSAEASLADLGARLDALAG